MLKSSITFLSFVLTLFFAHVALGQGGQTLFGDVRVVGENEAVVPKDVTLILRREPDGEVGRQTVSSRGRYRFTNLRTGEYEIVVEVDGKEIGRLQQIEVRGLSNSPYGFQYDLDFRWRPDGASRHPTPGVLSAGDIYDRPASTKPLFHKAEEAVAKKKYDQAVELLKQVIETDKNDFQAWNALGSVYFAEEKITDAEQSYLQAIQLRPTSARAQLNLGRLRSAQKRFEDALEPLTKAVELQPASSDANLLLGECYLQLRKGSKAIPYLNEAAKLGHPEAHLRLGWLYNAAGLKEKAAIEYEEYLKKNPNYPDRDKLEKYIAANKKS